jgi:tetratricopeptide (TPR) repeat protein
MCVRICSLLILAGLLSSCGPSRETAVSKEMLYRRGHQLFLEQQFDSAAVLLNRSVALDSAYAAPVADLAELNYILSMQDTTPSPGRTLLLKRSRNAYVWLDTHGKHDADIYDRICSVAEALGDRTTMIAYAKKNAERYPYDRQYFNLGIAYFRADEFEHSIETLKEAVVKFKASPFIGGMYRQLGRSYMAIDRNQTAERIFYEGLSRIEERLKAVGGQEQGRARLLDDRYGILVALKGIHTLYRQTEKLQQVERLLNEAGPPR